MKNIISLIIFITSISFVSAQTLNVDLTSTGDKPEKISGNLQLENFYYAGDHSVWMFIHGDEELMKTVDFSFVDTKSFINGSEAKSEWSVVDFLNPEYAEPDDYFLIKPAVRAEYSLSKIVVSNAHLVKEKDNQLKVEFYYQDKLIATTELKFNILGFNDYTSDFCLLYNLPDEEGITDEVKKFFESNFSGKKWIRGSMSKYGWSTSYGPQDEEMGRNCEFQVLFNENNQYWTLSFTVDQELVDGKFQKPTFTPYNGLKTPKPISESCVKNLENK